MNPERWRRVEELYHAALECEPDGRAAFLEMACRGDEELKREVDSLMAQGGSDAWGPIDRPAWVNRGDLTDDSKIPWLAAGVEVGAYRIEAPLGAGGMGIVYRAFDTKLNRVVAIKLIRDRGTDATTRRRFQREAQ